MMNIKYIRKLATGDKAVFSDEDQQHEYQYLIENGYTPEKAREQITRDATLDYAGFFDSETGGQNKFDADSTGKTMQQSWDALKKTQQEAKKGAGRERVAGMVSDFDSALGVKNSPSTGLTDVKAAGMGIGASAAIAATKAVDKAVFGDKNFGAQSEAIDNAVHGISSALMKSGNPWLMLGAGALETGNFLTKAAGQTVEGFDVNIDSSGYSSDMGHQASKSKRDFGVALMPGLGGLSNLKMDKLLQDRNEKAQMALKAQNISDNIKFEQEARANSVDNVIRENQIALAGGIDTSLLAARRGGVIKRLEEYKNQSIKKAQNGAKLEQVETSKKPNILPTGELHKNKHDLDLEHITEKGIPVITVQDDSAETFQEIKKQEESIQQHAEVESLEIIFNKELTDYIEAQRKQWHNSKEKDRDLLLEVGKRITKELLYNTTDNSGLIQKQESKV